MNEVDHVDLGKGTTYLQPRVMRGQKKLEERGGCRLMHPTPLLVTLSLQIIQCHKLWTHFSEDVEHRPLEAIKEVRIFEPPSIV